MKVDSGIIEVGGFPLRYAIEGEGIPTLVIGSAIYYPRTFSEKLRSHLQLIFVDHRGFAVAPENVDASDWSLQIFIDDIECVRKQLGIESFFILGHSEHGYLALEYAKQYPQYVRGVVLIAVGPDQSDASARAADEYFEQIASPERKADFVENMNQLMADIAADPDNLLIHYLLRAKAKGWYDYHFDARPLWQGVTVNMPIFDRVWGNLFKTIDVRKGLSDLHKSVFLALRKYDCIVAPPATWSSIIPLFRDITVHIFEKSGHTPQLEEPEIFDAKLNQWIRKN